MARLRGSECDRGEARASEPKCFAGVDGGASGLTTFEKEKEEEEEAAPWFNAKAFEQGV